MQITFATAALLSKVASENFSKCKERAHLVIECSCSTKANNTPVVHIGRAITVSGGNRVYSTLGQWIYCRSINLPWHTLNHAKQKIDTAHTHTIKFYTY